MKVALTIKTTGAYLVILSSEIDAPVGSTVSKLKGFWHAMTSFQTVLVLGFALMGCNLPSSTTDENTAEDMIFAGPGEERFDVRFEVNISLPMPENEFLTLISDKNLTIERRGAGETLRFPKEPRRNPNFDMSTITHGYWLYVPRDAESTKTEIFVAFVDLDGMVQYIESHYQFDEPTFE